MCELFAVNAAEPIQVNDYLAEFFTHSEVHKDGWGISWRTDDAENPVFLYREGCPAWQSEWIPGLLAKPVEHRLLEAHIRRSTGSSVCVRNCHPFLGSDDSGHEWTLIHNGILLNEGLLASYDLKEAGETDSERAMLFLMDVLGEAYLRSGGHLDFQTRFDALAGALAQISNLNRLNLIMDDGTYTYVHTNTSEDTLHFRQLEDAVVFSTQPLGDEDERAQWQPVPRNRLIAYRDGHLVKTSTPHGYVFCEAICELRRIFGDDWESTVA